MKKLFILGLVLLMVVVFASTFAIAQKGKGAVKVDLTERLSGDGATDPGSGPAAGWVIINTTGSGKLQVEVHMYDAPEGTYDVYVAINPPPSELVTQLTTNKNGIGNAHFEYEIPEGVVIVEVKVVVKPVGTSAIIGYSNGLTEVPLK